MGDKWLKSLWLKNRWMPTHVSKFIGKPSSSASAWFRAGVIPTSRDTYTLISKFLQAHGYPEMSFHRVSILYEEQKRKHGILRDCIICGDEFESRTKQREICKKFTCRDSLYGTKTPAQHLAHQFNKGETLSQRGRAKPVTHDEIKLAVDRFLSDGGEIINLDEGTAEGVDSLSMEVTDAGFRD